jgi:Tfp pilus assembly PilM family ATPase
VFHSQWHAADKIEFAARLKSQLQVCRAALGKMQIERLSVCCNRKYHELLQQDFDQHWLMKIDYPDPFMYFRSSPRQTVAVAEENMSEYLVACGAAMREVPQW